MFFVKGKVLVFRQVAEHCSRLLIVAVDDQVGGKRIQATVCVQYQAAVPVVFAVKAPIEIVFFVSGSPHDRIVHAGARYLEPCRHIAVGQKAVLVGIFYGDRGRFRRGGGYGRGLRNVSGLWFLIGIGGGTGTGGSGLQQVGRSPESARGLFHMAVVHPLEERKQSRGRKTYGADACKYNG